MIIVLIKIYLHSMQRGALREFRAHAKKEYQSSGQYPIVYLSTGVAHWHFPAIFAILGSILLEERYLFGTRVFACFDDTPFKFVMILLNDTLIFGMFLRLGILYKKLLFGWKIQIFV